ncbi:MAG TPA: DUF2442 domain-containing protein [Ignavibacteria bacterium]|nr:DUF2442 domain-containing protein [Ignavibacteria bacterium]HMQ99560.1 DUF2442 domain-containing protein [Ignavibacteria bacterium]
MPMKFYHKVESIQFDDLMMILKVDNRTYTFQLKEISQKLLDANSKERKAFKIICSGYGINWPLIDEDLSIDGLIRTYNQLNS